MSRLRAPRIAGVAGGAGTSTVAAALHGYDQGRAVDEGFEVLTCRCTGDSLHAAATVVSWLAANSRPRPVLAVTCDGPVPARGPLRARLRMIEPQVAGLVVLPFVAHWRELTDPRREAAALAEAVLRSGLLQQPGSSGWPNRPSACEHPSMPNQPGQFGRPFRPDLAVAPALPLGGARPRTRDPTARRAVSRTEGVPAREAPKPRPVR